MSHLSSARIQAVADNEGSVVERDHAATCADCGAEVATRREQMASFSATLAEITLPDSSARRVESAVQSTSRAGGTRLRPTTSSTRWPAAVWGSAGLIAATILAAVFIAPMLKSDRGAVSASEILAQSANRLAQAATTGVELLEYELVLDGVTKDMMPDHANGAYRVRQAIDHGTPGRFRFASFDPGGQALSSIAQDPSSGRRVMMVNLDGQAYRFEVTVPANAGPSLPEMERLHMEASIAMMQASGNQMLEVVETPEGRRYRIEVPKVTQPVTNPVWDLTEARVMIDAADYRVTEFEVKGTFLRQPYSVSYRLLNRTVVANVGPGTFDVPRQPGEIVVSGAGSVLPARDAMVLALRELARLKSAAGNGAVPRE